LGPAKTLPKPPPTPLRVETELDINSAATAAPPIIIIS
jgi:hypothetical protein